MISQTVAQYLAVGTGIVAVPLTSLFKSKGWDVKFKTILALVVSVLTSLGVVIPAAIAGAPVNSGATIATSIAASQILYSLIFKGTKLDQKLTDSLVKPKPVVTPTDNGPVA